HHAQPISCFDCGPRLWLADADGTEVAAWEDGIGQARKILAAGGTVAVKGIGGFTLFCDARQAGAVARLRRRKRRPGKPFAVMAADAASAARFAELSPAQRRELVSPQRPIVLAPMGAGYDLADGVAPGLGDVGVMLPSAPLHQLLTRDDEVYVATSGNLSGEPLRHRNEEAVADLGGVVDAFLTHNRPIHVPVEDSVLMADAAATVPIRRSRGYAPLPIVLGRSDAAVLAVGGELKNTFAVTRDGLAFMSAHIGDMGSPLAQRAFARSVAQLTAIHGREIELVVSDLHPDYATTRWAERHCAERGLPLIQVQHHHAHALSLLAEHGVDPAARAVVAAFDGVGYGLDGHSWGGEVLALGGTADPLEFERVWHLGEYWLPGGDSAAAAPWKCAVALIDQLGLDGADLPPFAAAPAQELRLLRQLPAAAAAGLPGLIHRSTSAGRLFDAAASILGVRQRVTYEAQAAMELERLARSCDHAACAACAAWADWADRADHDDRADRADHDDRADRAAAQVNDAIRRAGADGGTVTRTPTGPPPAGTTDRLGPVAELLAATMDGARSGRARACLARRFHSGLAAITAAALVAAAEQTNAEVIGLTGGVFQNRLLTGDVLAAIQASAAGGRRVLTHHLVPAGDGGLALGQARAGYTLLTWSGP
ncbi:MAG: Sua5/YciO/YrdC/YwlC family protein, partial [Bifidobacteriaceae bacterium]|nr:Sua5/YciO/YrdC/YwlC family protein [Bifidobacteriaceae bacterium]